MTLSAMTQATQQITHDVFLSYSHADGEWVRNTLLPRLEQAALRVLVDFRDFRIGAPVLTEIERALAVSHRTLLVLSPSYLASSWTAVESILLQSQDPTNAQGRLIPVLLSACDLPLRLKYLIYIDLSDASHQATGLHRLVDSLSVSQVTPPAKNAASSDAVNDLDDQIQEVYRWTIADQIRESGAWGGSHVRVMERASGTPMSPLERQEGGIYSTFAVLRALLAYEKDPVQFRRREYAKQAKRYLIARQTRRGGFGRFVHSRSGKEIHPSIRHTAFAIAALIDLAGAPEVVDRGLRYLAKAPLEALDEDAAPAEAIAGLLYLIEKLRHAADPALNASGDSKTLIESSDSLFRRLSDLANLQDRAPLWPPYGGFAELAHSTALTTIDLVADFFPPWFESTLVDALVQLLPTRTQAGALPWPGAPRPDYGTSAYLLSILARDRFKRRIQGETTRQQLQRVEQRLISFLRSSVADPDFRYFTYCDNLPNLLLLGPSPR